MSSRAARIGLGAFALALVASGCAAIVGLDQTYSVDGGVEPTDASRDDAGGDAAPVTDATLPPDGSPGSGEDSGPGYWVTDTSFGGNGYVILSAPAATGPQVTEELPAVALEPDGGALLVAFGSVSGSTWSCRTYGTDGTDGGCTELAGTTGAATDVLVSSAGVAAAVVKTVSVGMIHYVSAVPLLGVTGSYPVFSGCDSVRGVGLTNAATVRTFIECVNSTRGVDFVRDAGTSDIVDYPLTPETQLLAAALEANGDYWAGGGFDGLGFYARGTTEQVYTGVGQISAGRSSTAVVTDMVLKADASALVVGTYSGATQGLFASSVSGVLDAGVVDASYVFSLGDVPIAPEPTSHTRLAQVRDGGHVIVTASASPAGLALVTIDDQGAPLPGAPGSAQLLLIDAGAGGSIGVGGAVGSRDGDAIYVAITLTPAGALPTLLVTRLVRSAH